MELLLHDQVERVLWRPAAERMFDGAQQGPESPFERVHRESFYPPVELARRVAPGHTREVSAEDLQDFVRQAIAPYKRPRAVEFRDELPRTSTGKLQRFKLR